MDPSSTEPKVPHRALITGCVMLATLMQALDSTIANVALPYMQGSMSASAEEITWVLTSYVIAAAIMTAPVGWMAVRFGRKKLYIVCLAGFTITSMMCGAAQNLQQIVVFRLLQGMCGAALGPLAQATMLDIYPYSRRPHAMAIFSSGVTMGPLMGPTLGGYLTDWYNWRYVFYVNLPFGIFAIVGLLLFMPNTKPRQGLRFSWAGFAMLALALGALQLMLDRGEEQDWFTSREIIIEAVLAGLGFYLFIVHMFTAEKPFLPPAMFRDRNFVAAFIMVVCISSVMLATSALLAPYLQNLAGYPVYTAGLSLSPRSFGTVASMFLAARLSKWIDQRKLMAIGFVILGWALHAMSAWTPDVTEAQMIATLVIQGLSIGLVFNPLAVIAFSTLAPHFRGDGTALQALARNIGAAIGISVTSFTLERSAQAMHADIAAGITPFDRLLQHTGAARIYDLATQHGAALLNQEITRQSQIIAYNNDFHMMAFIVVPPLLLILLMRGTKVASPRG